MRIVGFEPCFRVLDIERAVAHYQRLGFATSHHDETYAFAHRDELTIHLAHDDDPTHHLAMIYLHVDDADELAREWRAAGVEVSGPSDYDYGKHEGFHRDPDGISSGSAAHSVIERSAASSVLMAANRTRTPKFSAVAGTTALMMTRARARVTRMCTDGSPGPR